MSYRLVYNEEDHIAHGHKYYTKIDKGSKNGKKISRYFYSLAEYQAYLRDKRKTPEKGAKKNTKIGDTYRFTYDPKTNSTKATKSEEKTERKSKAAVNSLNLMSKVLSTKPGWLAAKTAYNVIKKVTDKAKGDMDQSRKMRETYEKPIGPENKMPKENTKPKEETKPKENTKPKEETKSKENTKPKENVKPKEVTKPDKESTKEEPKDTRSTYEKFVDNLMNKLGIKKKAKQDKPTDDLKNINPDYDPNDYGTTNNCAWCTAAFDLSRRGYDVEAKAISPLVLNTEEVITDWYKGEKLRDMADGASDYINKRVDEKRTHQIYNNLIDAGFSPADANTGTMANLVAEKVKSDILADAKGSKESWGHTLIYWRGTEGKQDGGGHDIAYYTKGNDVKFYDCQNGQEYELADIIFASGMIWTNTKTNETVIYNDQMKFFRSDNCEIETGATDGVKPRRKKGNK